MSAPTDTGDPNGSVDAGMASTQLGPPPESQHTEQRLAQARIKQALFGPADDRPAPAEYVGRYRLVRLLGRGGMGVVYEATDEKLDRRVAIKLLRDRVRHTVARPRLEREAKAMARLAHPNVVSVYEVGAHKGEVFVAMEFIKGLTMRRWLAEPHPLDEVLAVLDGCAAGLAAAHDAGIVHRDFKPDNVMIDAAGQPRILDFGLARDASRSSSERVTSAATRGKEGVSTGLESDPDDPHATPAQEGQSERETLLTRAGTVMGTPAYMSPEQLSGQTVGPKSDQYSFFVTAWEAVFGCRPFPDPRLGASESPSSLALERIPQRALTKASSARTSVSGRTPRALVQAMRRGLSVLPEGRHADMHAAREALARPLRWRRRWRWAAVSAGALALSATFAYRSAQPDPCPDPAERVRPLWNPKVRANLARASADLGDAQLDVRWPLTAAQLDLWSATWRKEVAATCSATHLDGRQSTEDHRVRSACLDEALFELEAVLALAARDERFLKWLLPTARAIRDPRECGPKVPTPVWKHALSHDAASTELRRAVAAFRVLTRFNSEENPDLVEWGSGTIERIDPILTERGSALAQVHVEYARWRFRWAETFTAEHDELRQLYALAERAGDDEVSAELAIDIAGVVSADESRHWWSVADAKLERLGSPAEKQFNVLRKRLNLEPGRLAEANAIYDRIRPDPLTAQHPHLWSGLLELAKEAAATGDYDLALNQLEHAAKNAAQNYGTPSDALRRVLSDYSEHAVQAGRCDDFRRLLETYPKAVAPHHGTTFFPRSSDVGLWDRIGECGAGATLLTSDAMSAHLETSADAIKSSGDAENLVFFRLALGTTREFSSPDSPPVAKLMTLVPWLRWAYRRPPPPMAPGTAGTSRPTRDNPIVGANESLVFETAHAVRSGTLTGEEALAAVAAIEGLVVFADPTAQLGTKQVRGQEPPPPSESAIVAAQLFEDIHQSYLYLELGRPQLAAAKLDRIERRMTTSRLGWLRWQRAEAHTLLARGAIELADLDRARAHVDRVDIILESYTRDAPLFFEGDLEFTRTRLLLAEGGSRKAIRDAVERSIDIYAQFGVGFDGPRAQAEALLVDLGN